MLISILAIYALLMTAISILVILKLHKTIYRYKRFNLMYYLEKLLGELPASSVVTNSKGLVVYVNSAFIERSGYSEDELRGQNISMLKSNTDGEYISGDLWHHITAGKVWRGPFINRHKDGSTYTDEFVVFPVHDPLGDLYYCSLGSNIINRYLENKEIEQVQRQSIKFKENFISNLSHEVRTPLNAMIGLSQLGQRNDHPEKHLSYFTKINDSAKQLMQLMDDILDFSKIESGNFSLVHSRFNFMSLLTSLIGQYGPQAAEKKLEFNFYIDEYTPQYLYADSFRLEQILANLLSNAIKFTEKGEVSLTIRLNKAEGSGYALNFKVVDTGIGMDQNQLVGIFNPFSQLVADNQKRHNNSSGLGMAITKQIVDLMQGIILVDSHASHGTTVEVILPFSGNDLEMPKPHDAVTVEHLKVMVIDDALNSRDNARYMLEGFGYEVVTADSGLSAIESLTEDSSPDLILLDWHMPDMDGEETLMQIIKVAKEGTKILFITPYGAQRISEESRRNIHGYLPKPYTASMLFDGIVTLFASKQLENITTHVSGSLFKGYFIMLVDDNPVNNLIAKNFFEGEGAKTTTFIKATQALEYLKKHHTDFIVSDIDMPEMDGYEFYKAVREQGYTMPVYALTANTSDHNRQQIQQAGFDAYISKPLTHEKLSNLSELVSISLPKENNLLHGEKINLHPVDLDLNTLAIQLSERQESSLHTDLIHQLNLLKTEAQRRKPKGCKEILNALRKQMENNEPMLVYLDKLQTELQRYKFETMIESLNQLLVHLGGEDQDESK